MYYYFTLFRHPHFQDRLLLFSEYLLQMSKTRLYILYFSVLQRVFVFMQKHLISKDVWGKYLKLGSIIYQPVTVFDGEKELVTILMIK